jgi:hypothetical protein
MGPSNPKHPENGRDQDAVSPRDGYETVALKQILRPFQQLFNDGFQFNEA